MMRKIQALLLFFAILLASCTSEDPGSAYAWCYTYDFATSNYGVNIISGSWVDTEGLRSDETGLLQVNWTHSQPVEPKRVEVTVVRPPGTVGEVAVNASAIAFGVSVEIYGATLHSEENEVTVSVLSDYAGASGSSVNFTMEASAPLSISSLQFFGDFASPFPENPCAPPTPTSSATATDPYYLTQTATWTATALPTGTSTPDPLGYMWEVCEVDFSYFNPNTSEDHDFPECAVTDDPWGYAYQLSSVSLPGNGAIALNIPGGGFASVAYGLRTWCETAHASSCTTYFPGANQHSTTGSISIWDYMRLHTTGNNVLLQAKIILYLIAENPQSTPTPTITYTPSITPTRTPLFGGTPPFVNPPTRTPINALTATKANTPTDLPASNTPQPPKPTNTTFPLPTAFQTPVIDPGATPDPNANPATENEGEWEILGALGDFFSWLANVFFKLFEMFGQIMNWLGGTLSNIVTLISNLAAGIVEFINGVVALIQELFDIGRLLIEIIVRLIELVMSWIAQAAARVGLVLNGFFTAPTIPIPGMPLCATNPMGSDVCAIYYILDYTLLARGTPGEYIVPLLTIVINVFIVLFFVRYVLRLLRRGESVTNVG